MQRLTVTHVTRWQKHYNMVGYGHVYQSRYKSFPVQTDDYFYQVMRYVERNALRANLVSKAENWQFGSLNRKGLVAALVDVAVSDHVVVFLPSGHVSHG